MVGPKHKKMRCEQSAIRTLAILKLFECRGAICPEECERDKDMTEARFNMVYYTWVSLNTSS